MNTIQITQETVGQIRELHSVNCAPYKVHFGSKQTAIDQLFGYIKPPRSRLHDVCYPWGWERFVDIPNIFPNFDADVNDPASYNFYFTDEYITGIMNAGTQIVYRLGVSIEHASKKQTTIPPANYQKWAEICEHVIRHYNEGWANGFHYGITYWEIWNEPENPPMWQGTEADFMELYRISSTHLKKCFPKLKIGGYGSCGFYAAFQQESGAFQKSFLTWFDDFLAMVRKSNCPLDFFSWHIYTDDPKQMEFSQSYVREHLDAMGFANTESHLNEWNFGPGKGGFAEMETMVGAAFCASAMITMQESGIDMGMYYIADGTMCYSGLTDLRTGELTPPAHVFAAFSRLYQAKNELKTVRTEEDPMVLAAGDGNTTCVLISNYGKQDQNVELQMDSCVGQTLYFYELADASGFVLKEQTKVSEKLHLSCNAGKVFYLVASKTPSDDGNQYLF